MRLDLYQAETALIAREQTAILDEARAILLAGNRSLSRLERNGVLHAFQILVENAIGKAKQLLKAAGEPVPVSAYDAFAVLCRRCVITDADLSAWNAAIGLRNRIVHDYMNIDMELVRCEQYRFVSRFLESSIVSD
ncbi:type VII toxin-antitoxin system HepT family RNase toxin [Geobacter argillaceus]|uniref:Uncharacterized protein DUF86 n=1 Tax=Geobacter argillaceus TaxID=345631 RepID=A0A562VNF7_9BACT|nr:DUF86 domain-containing protein [Geobacter argillaceus]TWJ19311.1 uncharacterized protein DUF86 [Geobacter argillaceus]